MTTKISGKFLGGKRVELHHIDSGAIIQTDAPKDNNGDGTLFSPTDLFSSSLGACMITVMSIFAERRSINIDGSRFEVIKEMSQSPRRVGKLDVTFYMPAKLTEEERDYLEKSAKSCPVHHSLHPDIILNYSFVYTE